MITACCDSLKAKKNWDLSHSTQHMHNPDGNITEALTRIRSYVDAVRGGGLNIKSKHFNFYFEMLSC